MTRQDESLPRARPNGLSFRLIARASLVSLLGLTIGLWCIGQRYGLIAGGADNGGSFIFISGVDSTSGTYSYSFKRPSLPVQLCVGDSVDVAIERTADTRFPDISHPFPGLWLQRLNLTPTGTVTHIVVQYPLIITPLATLTIVVFLRTSQRSRAFAVRHCPACGYDLRATPDRCPECGQSVATQEGENTNRHE